jgi:hypothetical protein
LSAALENFVQGVHPHPFSGVTTCRLVGVAPRVRAVVARIA